jgi:hypothetical protein
MGSILIYASTPNAMGDFQPDFDFSAEDAEFLWEEECAFDSRGPNDLDGVGNEQGSLESDLDSMDSR